MDQHLGEYLGVEADWSLDGDPGDAIEVISPHTEQPIARVAASRPADVDVAVAAARTAVDHGPWPRLDPAERIAAIRRLAELYSQRRGEMAQLSYVFVRARRTGSPVAAIGEACRAQRPRQSRAPGSTSTSVAFGGSSSMVSIDHGVLRSNSTAACVCIDEIPSGSTN
ncbi:aldehyde dehydrogenase family protein, partial [Mycolicibacterium porcinum]|uniref:aldehyde dehydrogenase family protein n=1 Tax=Mycolicibacterium porcinum TaxID=39693 RepID=UPI00256F0875